MRNGTTKHNNFSEHTRFYLLEDNEYKCSECGKNHANCLHHIFGRGSPEDDVESSPLNACPLNNFECHLAKHGYLMTDKGKARMFKKTLSILQGLNYKLTDKDNRFLIKYANEINKFYD